MKASKIQYAITLIAVIAVIIHIIWPKLAIDGITLTLFIVAIIPWLAPLFKSLEFPGGWKIEFQELQKTKSDAEKAGLLADSASIDQDKKYSFEVIANDDPNLALAGLRIEIEKRLQNIAASKNIPTKRLGVGNLMRELAKDNIITQQQYSVLADMIGLLNSAVHGADVNEQATEWAMDTGPRLLKSLDELSQN